MKNKKICISVIFVLILSLFVTGFNFAFKVNADTEDNNIWSGEIESSFESGNGSKDSPYEIVSGAQLAYLAQEVNNGNSFESKYFVLQNDIDLNSYLWEPIGGQGYRVNNNYENRKFSGYFDGKNHTIKNLHLENSNIATNYSIYVGLFGLVDGSHLNDESLSISNIKLVDARLEYAMGSSRVNHFAGFIAGKTINTDIFNCSVKNESIDTDFGEYNVNATAPISYRMGTIVGEMENSSMTYCNSSAIMHLDTNPDTVKVMMYIGGLCGKITVDVNKQTTISLTNSYYDGNITFDCGDSEQNLYFGGLVGYVEARGEVLFEVQDCYASCSIETGSLLAYQSGLIGVINPLSNSHMDINIKTSYFYGELTSLFNNYDSNQTSAIFIIENSIDNANITTEYLYYNYDNKHSENFDSSYLYTDDSIWADESKFNFDFSLTWEMSETLDRPVLKSYIIPPSFQLVHADNSSEFYESIDSTMLKSILDSQQDMNLYVLKNARLENDIEFELQDGVRLFVQCRDTKYTINVTTFSISISGEVYVENVKFTNSADSVKSLFINAMTLNIYDCEIYNNAQVTTIHNSTSSQTSIYNCIIESNNDSSTMFINELSGTIDVYSSTITSVGTVFENYSMITIHAIDQTYITPVTINLTKGETDDKYILKQVSSSRNVLFSISSQTVINNEYDVDVMLNQVSTNNNSYQIETIDDDKEISLIVEAPTSIVGSEEYYIVGKSFNNSNNLSLTATNDKIYQIKKNGYVYFTGQNKAYLSKNWKDKLPFNINDVKEIEFVSSVVTTQDYQQVMIGAQYDFTTDVSNIDDTPNIICYYKTENEKYILKIYSDGEIVLPNDSSNLFSDFTNLTKLVFANILTKNVENITEMFKNLNNLSSLDLSIFDMTNVSQCQNVFMLDDKLFEIVLPSSNIPVNVLLNENISYYVYNSNNVSQKASRVTQYDNSNKGATLKAVYSLVVNGNGGVFDSDNNFEINNDKATKLYFYDEQVASLPNITKVGYQLEKFIDENNNEFNTGTLLVKNTTLNAVWKEDTNIPFNFEVYVENDNGEYILNSQESSVGYTNEVIDVSTQNIGGQNVVVVKDKTFEIKQGYEYKYSKYFNGTLENTQAIVDPVNALVIKVYVGRKSFNVSINATTSTNGGGQNGGSASLDKNNNVTSSTALFNSYVKVYISYTAGYLLKNATAVSGGVSVDLINEKKLADELSVLVQDDIVINVEFELQEFVVTLNQNENGDINFVDNSGNLINGTSQKVYYGQEINVKATAHNGYKFKHFNLSTSATKLNQNPLNITNITENINISADFIEIFNITFNFDDTKGSVVVNGSNVTGGQTLSDIETQSHIDFVFTPKDSHTFCNYVKINGTNQTLVDESGTNAKKLSLVITQDMQVEIEFDEEKFAVGFSANINNVSSLQMFDLDTNTETTQSSFTYGKRLSLRVSNIQTGYRIKQWLVDNEVYKDSQNETYTQDSLDIIVTKQVNVVVEFEILVTINQNTHGTIKVENSQTSFYASLNQNVNIAITADRGYKLSALLGDLSQKPLSENFTETITKPVTFECLFESKEVLITIVCEKTQGIVEITSTDTKYTIGSEVTFEVTENTGYKFTNYVVSYKNGAYTGLFKTGAKQQTYTVTIDDVENEELIVNVNFEVISYTIIVNATNGGSVECDRLIDGKINITYFDNISLRLRTDGMHKVKSVVKITEDSEENITNQVNEGFLLLSKDNYTLDITFTGITWLDDNIRAENFTGGNGSQDYPFLISNPRELGLMAYLINNGEYNAQTGIYYNKAYYQLTQSISLLGNYFVPIGINEQNSRFEGVFDYQYNRIYSSVVEDESIETIEDNVFGVCYNAKFINKYKTNYILYIGIGLTVFTLILIVIAIIIKKKRDKKPKRVVVIPPKTDKNVNAPKFSTSNEIPRPNFDRFNNTKK